MARNFMPSMGGSKSGSKRGSVGEFAKKNPDFMKLDPSKRNQLLTEMKMNAKKADTAYKKFSTGVSAPGASGAAEKELSKTAKDMIENMIQKQLKKRKKEVIAIRACWFGNGRITKDGRIFDANNKQVGKIDPDTMKITIGWGSCGKYKDDSFTLGRLQRKIDSLSTTNKPATSAPSISLGNFYGTAESSTNNWW